MRVLIVGASRVGRTLAAELLHAHHDVHVLDSRAAALARLPHDFDGRTVHGSPLDEPTLAGAADGCDAIACVSDDDNLNAIVALAARRVLRLPRAIAIVGNPRRAEALTGFGAHVICPTTRTSHAVHLALVRSDVEAELTLGGDVAVYRVDVPPRLAGRALAELTVAGQVVPLAIERRSEVLLAAPDLRLAEGDAVHLAAADRGRISELMRP